MRCRWRFVLAWSFLLLALPSVAAPEAGAHDPSGDVLVRNSFLDVDDAFGFTAEQLPTGATRLKWQIAPDHYLYRERHDILGPPTLLWIGPDGIERRPARLVGEITAAEFLKHWQTLRERG